MSNINENLNTAAAITAIGQIIAGAIASLRALGEHGKADALANTMAADDNWRQADADDPNAPPTSPVPAT